LAIATIKHRMDAIKFAHRMADLPLPTEDSAVRLAVRRVRRAQPRHPAQALGLISDLLWKMVAACPDTRSGLRDAALISVGYDTLCRSLELVAMHVEHLSEDCSRIHVPRSKADPFGEGRVAYLSAATSERVLAWLEAADISAGPLFRSLHRRRVSSEALQTSSIRRLIKVAARRADLQPEIVGALSGHSMRVVAAQDMMVAGIDTIGIMQAGGWKSQSVLARYVENASAEKMHQRRWGRLSAMAHETSMPAPAGPAYMGVIPIAGR
jgi:integrase